MTSTLLTNSRMSTFRSCQRKHHIKYVLGYRPVAIDDDLSFGSLVHLGLEAWWKAPLGTGSRDERLSHALHAMGNADQYAVARAQAMLIGYDARWGDEPLEPVAVEAEFRAPGPAGFTKAGKMDAIVRSAAGIHIMEHKTSSQDITPGSLYWRKLRTDSQVSMYFDGARALGHDVVDCIYDVLGKPLQRPKNDEPPDAFRQRCIDAISLEPDRYYQRQHITRLEKDMAESEADTAAIASQMSLAQGHVPRNPDACQAFNKLCPYFGVCAGEQSLDNPEHFTQLDNVHPELETDHAKGA